MAIIWRKKTKDTLYEIRTAGNSRRLYANKVFHSQYNPNNSVTGNVWDLLSLPVLLLPPGRPLKVLLLGVGGGAVIHQLQQWRGNCDITGIELNQTHLMIARRFFGVTDHQARLVHDDARRWVNRPRKTRFDLVIDDLFGHEDGEPQRAIAVTRDWAESLDRLLTPDGMIVTNFVNRQELTGSAYCACADLRKGFPQRFQLSTPLYENRVGVYARRPIATENLRQRLQQVPELRRALNTRRLRYQLRPLTPQVRHC